MKNSKIISMAVIILFVIALGIFLGKQCFKLFEASQSSPQTSTSAQVSPESTEALPLPSETEKETGTNTTATSGYSELPPANSLYPVMEAPRTAPVIEDRRLASSDPLAQANQQKSSSVATSVAQPHSLPPVIENNNAKTTSIEPVNISQTTTAKRNDEIANDSSKSTTVANVPDKVTYAYANGSGINVRNGPSTSNVSLFKIGKDTKGTVLERKKGWTYVKWDFNKKSGWVRDDLLRFSSIEKATNKEQKTTKVSKPKQLQPVTEESKVAVAVAKPANLAETTNSFAEGSKLPREAVVCAETFANIRSQASTNSESIAKIPKGMIVTATNVKKIGKWQWFEIVFQGGRKKGWTREDNLKF